MRRKIASIILIFSFIFPMIVPSGANAADSNETVSRESILMQLISLPSGVSAGRSTVKRGNYAEALAAQLGRSAETS